MGVFLGADGGASKLMLCLSVSGARHYCKLQKGVNPFVSGRGSSVSTIIEAMKDCCARNGVGESEVDGIFAGIAGATEKDYKSELKAALEKTFPNAACGVSHDGENIIYAAFPSSDGAIIICGTGSSCFVHKGGEIFRIGGYGKFDIEGNGCEIGKRAIAHTLKSYDGRAERSVLCEKVEQLAGGNCLEKLDELISLPVKEVASFAKAVFDSARAGDCAALEIIDSSARFLASYADAASRYFEGGFDICTAGSIGTDGIMLSAITKYAPSRARIFALGTEPVEGALVKAERLYYGRKH
ncbi:MAG: hypothetical protein J5760_03070 [Clostridia bacterium]|nr:hypothetical protein [Clostridia bacterium]